MINDLLADIEENGRMIDYYSLVNLFDYKQSDLMEELKKYQNPDGGFGHGLEPDTMLPSSSVVCTNEAIHFLNEIEDSKIKENVIRDIVKFFESKYIKEIEGWELVPKDVDNYPHAIWWDYSKVKDFTYGNPNPQIIGFLYNNSHFIKKLDINYLIAKVIKYIETDFLKESSKHNLLSCLIFYTYMPQDIQDKIHDILQKAVSKELKVTKWEEYSLQPYEILLIDPIFLEKHLPLLEENIEYCFEKLSLGLIQPNWQWHQYEEDFNRIKSHWAGRLTFNVIKAILLS
ncbi:MAG: hypothetical protein JEZ05_07685 [Tenericutes bacterium]|nr:hypothetical protein [Mycoplasmatota bacterium]